MGKKQELLNAEYNINEILLFTVHFIIFITFVFREPEFPCRINFGRVISIHRENRRRLTTVYIGSFHFLEISQGLRDEYSPFEGLRGKDQQSFVLSAALILSLLIRQSQS